MHVPTHRLLEASVRVFGGAAGARRAVAAHRHIPRRAHAQARTQHFWNSDMDQPPTERPANTAKLEVPLPQDFPAAFQRLVDARNQMAERGRRRIYARHLYEEAIGELIHLASYGRVTFIATPFRNYLRKMFWVERTLKDGVEHLALAHGITRSVVVITAFQLYLDRHGALQEPAITANMLDP